jgi:hypothetical protein
MPLLLVEGMSDTAAAMTIGLQAIGRPSNTGGGPMLVALLRRMHWQGPIVVLGENDWREPKMPKGMTHPADCKGCAFCWPGAYGAAQIAKILWDRLPRPRPPILIRMPSQSKDLRQWVNDASKQTDNSGECRRLGESLLHHLGIEKLPLTKPSAIK